LSVYTAMGCNISVNPNMYNVKMDSTLIRRYKIDYDYETVYLDLDDTLIINNQVHLPSIKFLYQCKNQGKKIILLTKHDGNVEQTLLRYCINTNLFGKIIHVDENEEKSDYIDPKKAIFIDNAFKEREMVQNKYNMPVFDVDGIEFLLDWKM